MSRVILIDDENIIVEGLRRVIKWADYGCQVIGTASDAVEGAELIRKLQPHIVFTDIRMPGVDGLTMLAGLRSEFPDMQVTVLTGYRDFSYAQEAIRLGVTRFLLKPSKMDELKEAVETMVARLDKLPPEELEKQPQNAGSFIVNQAMLCIEKNYSAKLTLQMVADSCYVSQWHLSKLLNGYAGKDFYPLLIEAAVLERIGTTTAIVTGDLGSGNVLSYYYDAADPSKDIGSIIVNKFATPEFEKFAKKVYEYALKGFIFPSCQSTATANDYRTATQNAGEYLIGTQSYAFGCELDYSVARGIDVRMVPAAAAYMDCTSGQGAMMAISATSKNPERALMFLNLLNTDPYVMTMLNYGVEGYTYSKNADGTISFITENRANYSPWTNGVGNVRIMPPTDAQGADFWDRFSAYYNAAQTLPYGGFIFDGSALETEQAALANVFAEYAFNLMSGAVNPDEVLPVFLSKLEEAGINEFVAAANEQMEAYIG